MAIVKWKFNDTLENVADAVGEMSLNFTSNGITYNNFVLENYDPSDGTFNTIRYDQPNGDYIIVYENNAWLNTKYQYIEVDDTSTDYANFVEWAKENGGVLLEAGEYKWVDEPNLSLLEDVINIVLDFTTGNMSGSNVQAQPTKGGNILYAWSTGGDETIYFGAGSWSNETYKTITTTTNQYINYDFYTWAITGNQLIKQTSNKVTIDLTTLSGWDSVEGGTHTLQVAAKADGYKDSEKSTAISFTKVETPNYLLTSNDEALQDSQERNIEYGKL